MAASPGCGCCSTRRPPDLRTRLSICRRKARFASEVEARAAAERAPFVLLPYVCDRCGQFHLTSRTKGKRVRPASTPFVPSEVEGQAGPMASGRSTLPGTNG